MKIENRVREIQKELRIGLQATWKAIKELENIRNERSWLELKGFEESTFKIFLEDNFNLTLYMFEQFLMLIKKYKKANFDKFGPTLLREVHKYSKNPEETLEKMKLQAKKDKVVSIVSMRKIINEDRLEKKPSSYQKLKINKKSLLKKEIDMWVRNNWITKLQANTLKEYYSIIVKKVA